MIIVFTLPLRIGEYFVGNKYVSLNHSRCESYITPCKLSVALVFYGVALVCYAVALACYAVELVCYALEQTSATAMVG